MIKDVIVANTEDVSRGVLCCDVSPDGNLVAAGTELRDDDASILYWYRLLWFSIPRVQYS